MTREEARRFLTRRYRAMSMRYPTVNPIPLRLYLARNMDRAMRMSLSPHDRIALETGR